ncbi:MAG: DNA-3-methyladenine glycosylase [Candidatus Marinimicrobia bacterium]|jgi:DNA-3-methyladenine glycosylase|nr:DNA-3-methyladenine glycosylase [Candidatus Neomarinimicrobiota bacterium]MBT4361549.1 DNA-3-methyladenine glycosylase [Candidatus Neomarinimicrobiota bacterium]MBT4481036.1 DNA-3-methyladenine glycosylase [Candidatus Neomarinimicrobiota bacterium]MBT4947901.1 DNA-3-methyladenine glycosylase [Candidatus Neomarinimicrobiota bacterium]MBT5271234.1 DNA-3-methyladenine glycosylase [Candidatus Neomarinimicrobiota bacterium]
MEHLKQLPGKSIDSSFFDREPLHVAKSLLGKIIAVRHSTSWLMARIIETEAYYRREKASHSSLGFTEKRRALFMPPGTIYMYYARGGDSLNFSCRGEGNAVLIKSGYPISLKGDGIDTLSIMQSNNPNRNGSRRSITKLCTGQTLLCKSLNLKVSEWDSKQLTPHSLELWDDTYFPEKIIQTKRLGIPHGRDTHLPYRFIDLHYADFCTKNPLRVRNFQMGLDYTILQP